MTAQEEFRVAILHQAAATPAIGGISKPVKLGELKSLAFPSFGGKISHWPLSRRIQGQ